MDIEARWSARVLVLLLLLLRVVESTGWVLALAGIAEGTNEESTSSVDRIWFKVSGGRVGLKMTEGQLVVVVVGMLPPRWAGWSC